MEHFLTEHLAVVLSVGVPLAFMLLSSLLDGLKTYQETRSGVAALVAFLSAFLSVQRWWRPGPTTPPVGLVARDVLGAVAVVAVLVALLLAGCAGPYWRTPAGQALQASLATCAAVEATKGATDVADALKEAYSIEDPPSRDLAVAQLRLRIAASLATDAEAALVCLTAAAVRSWSVPPASPPSASVLLSPATPAGLARAREALGWGPDPSARGQEGRLRAPSGLLGLPRHSAR